MFDPRPRRAVRAEGRSPLLARAGTLLDSSLDDEVMLANVARLAVPALADWCSVDVLDETGSVKNVALTHVDTAKLELAQELRRRYPEDPHAPGAVHRVLRTGEPELHRDIPDAMLVEAARDAEELRLLRAVGMRSAVIVPLVAQGRTLGAMTLIAAESGRRFDEDDFALAEELAERCALALDNARLHREAREAERRQAESLAVVETVFAHAPAGLALWDRELRYLRVNESLAAMSGLTSDEHIGRTVEEVLPEIGAELADTLNGVLRTGEPVTDREVTGETPAAPGSRRHWLASYYPVPDPGGGMLGVGAVVMEITARRRAEEAQRQRASQQAAVVELGRCALAGTEPSELMEQAASLVAETLGVEYCEVSQLLPDRQALILRAGTGWREGRVGAATTPAGRDSPAGLALLSADPVIVEDLSAGSRFSGAALLREHGVASGMTVVIPGPGERPFGVLAVHTSTRREFSAGDTSFLEAVANLLASAIERRHAEEESHHRALHDHLTGLPDRTLFLDRVAQALARADRRAGSPALLFFDLDRFKVINDSLGHAAGDELLVAVATRLKETVRREDTLSRFGGDEFTVLCEEVADEAVATALAGRIASALEAPFRIGDRDVFVGASIGIVFARDASETPESLLRDADAAMYHAKERGRGRYEVFHERMRPQALERLTTESALRQAIEADGFRVVYQPVIDLRTRAVVGAEALVGALARVVAECRPEGRVRVHGELWRARCDAGAAEGEDVVVRAVDGLTLLVEPRLQQSVASTS